MSYGTNLVGAQTTLGAKKAATWNTAVLLGALNQFDFVSEGLTEAVTLIPDETIIGSVQERAGDKGNEVYSGPIAFNAKYEGLELFLALALGTAGAPSQVANRTTADGVGNTGTATKITSATAVFTTNDVGKRITLAGAGTAGALLDTTITARDSATQVTIAGTVATTVSGAALNIYDTAYKHVWKPKADLVGLFATIGFNKQLQVFEYPTAKVGGFKLAAKRNSHVSLEVTLHPGSRNLNTSTGTNTTATIVNLTLPANRNFLKFADLAVRMNTQGGSALATNTDALYLEEFNLEYMNPFPTDEVSTQYGYLIDEPIRDGRVTVKGSLKFSRYATHSKGMLDRVVDKAQSKMDVIFTGPLTPDTGSATHFALNMYLNGLQFAKSDGANVKGPGRVGVAYDFECHEQTSAPTGFTAGYTDALIMENVNQRSTDALA